MVGLKAHGVPAHSAPGSTAGDREHVEFVAAQTRPRQPQSVRGGLKRSLGLLEAQAHTGEPHRREDARRWATEAEGRVDQGDMPIPSRMKQLKTFGDLVDLHIEDMKEVGDAP